MAYYGRRSYNRRPYRRYRRAGTRSNSSWGNTAWNLAKTAAKGVVKYYLNPEYKFLDWTNATFSPSTVPETFGDISWLSAGTNEITRTGNTIKVTSLQGQLILKKATAATATDIRIVIFSAADPDGVAPSWTDVFETADVNAFRNKDTGRSYKIMYDRKFTLDANTPIRNVKIYKKLQHHIKYIASTATDTALGNGAIFLTCMSNETGTSSPIVNIRTRMRFLDN